MQGQKQNTTIKLEVNEKMFGSRDVSLSKGTYELQMYVPLKKNTLLKIQIQIHKNTTRKVDVSADQCPAIIRQMEQWSTNGAIGSHSVFFLYILYIGSHSIQRKPSFPRTAFVRWLIGLDQVDLRLHTMFQA